MSKEGRFLIFCIEIYKLQKQLTGKETINLFSKYRVQDYISNYYEALHTTSEKYIVNDIDLYIKARQSA